MSFNIDFNCSKRQCVAEPRQRRPKQLLGKQLRSKNLYGVPSGWRSEKNPKMNRPARPTLAMIPVAARHQRKITRLQYLIINRRSLRWRLLRHDSNGNGNRWAKILPTLRLFHLQDDEILGTAMHPERAACARGYDHAGIALLK